MKKRGLMSRAQFERSRTQTRAGLIRYYEGRLQQINTDMQLVDRTRAELAQERTAIQVQIQELQKRKT